MFIIIYQITDSLFLLTDEILRCVENIISKAVPKLPIKRKGWIPNYEGRMMSLILFTLKLLFGLDGVTEFHFSKYAELINNSFKRNTFDIISWIQYIAFRKLFMEKYHFPEYHKKNSEINSDLLFQYSISQNVRLASEVSLTKEAKDFEEVLTKIKSFQSDICKTNTFSANLIPFTQYFSMLLKIHNDTFMRTIFDRNYKKDEIDFLLKPNKYFDSFDNNVEIINGGANNKWIMNELNSFGKNISRTSHKLEVVEIVDNGYDILHNFKHIDSIRVTKDPLTFQEYYSRYRNYLFRKNSKYAERVYKHIKFDCIQTIIPYETHYNPFERYWLNLINNIDSVSKNEFNSFFQNYCSTFKIIFDECSRIIEQSHSEFFKEYQITELYLTYSSDMSKNETFRPKRFLDSKLNYLISEAEEQW